MRRTLISLSGVTGSGRRSAARLFTRFGFEVVAFRDELYEEAFAEGWSGQLDYLGTEVIRRVEENRQKSDPLYWIRRALDRIDRCGSRVVIPDTRTHAEMVNMRDRGALLWRITRPGLFVPDNRVLDIEHLTFDFDRVIENNKTLADLEGLVGEALRESGLL